MYKPQITDLDDLTSNYMKVCDFLTNAILDGDLDKIALHATQMRHICEEAVLLAGRLKVSRVTGSHKRIAGLSAMATRK